jgi:tripartite-type tricarboxylate transporter receptor subunit TctC
MPLVCHEYRSWRPVRIIVGFTAGSATDITAHLLREGKKLCNGFRRHLVVDCKNARHHQNACNRRANADTRERIAQLGLEASVNSPEEFAVVIKTDTAKWAKVIRAANIKAE